MLLQILNVPFSGDEQIPPNWGKRNYPEAKIKPLHLSVFDEEDLNNRKRRDKLYDRIGLINYKGLKYLSELTPHCETRGFEITLEKGSGIIAGYQMIHPNSNVIIQYALQRPAKVILDGEGGYEVQN